MKSESLIRLLENNFLRTRKSNLLEYISQKKNHKLFFPVLISHSICDQSIRNSNFAKYLYQLTYNTGLRKIATDKCESVIKYKNRNYNIPINTAVP